MAMYMRHCIAQDTPPKVAELHQSVYIYISYTIVINILSSINGLFSIAMLNNQCSVMYIYIYIYTPSSKLT